MMDSFDSTTRTRHRVDWRGWVALAWVLGWGWAYGVMVFHARGQQVLAWLSQCGLTLGH